MNGRGGPEQKRGLVAIDGAMALIVLLLVVQIWLLSATLESFLAGHAGVVLPAAIFSALIFLCCLALNLFVERVDRDSRRQ
jgi:F0F1-type ATP synthase assembly protein I